jgi:small subunit ribosomal protein S9
MANDIKKNYISKVGKRKESVARLRLYKEVANLNIGDEKIKKGDIVVNGKKAEDYFKGAVALSHLLRPLKITNNLEKFAFTIKVEGGGTRGQLDAVIHAISRALSSMDEKDKAILKKGGFLTRDARVRERRKVGMGGKARRKRQSPKR